jgi:transposase
LTRYRAELRQAQTRVANRIQKFLEQANLKLASVASDVLGVSGRQILEAIIGGQESPQRLAELARGRLRAKIPELSRALEGRVRDHHRFMLAEYLDEWETLGQRITRMEAEIDKRIGPFESAVTLWKSIPGVDQVTACSLVAEIGVDMRQFPTARHLASWAALCPGNHESAGKRKSGKTREGNRWLRRTLCQAAWAATRKKDCYLSAQFKRLAARRGVRRAVMAVAHTLLIIAYTMLKTGKGYHELGGNYLEQINKDQLQRYFVKRLQRLGLKVTVEPAAAAA